MGGETREPLLGSDGPWITRPHDPGEPARHVRELSEALGSGDLRVNLWRYEPGAAGVRHRHEIQTETYFVLEGTLTVYLDEPPEPVEIPEGGAISVPAGTAVQSSNQGERELLVLAVGTPPEPGGSKRLPPAARLA